MLNEVLVMSINKHNLIKGVINDNIYYSTNTYNCNCSSSI